ncbi:MAG: hypothetical protein J5760_01395, partial [Clostridia bacterium]|nr:hypothetical protein [Clostridia bacterium]
MKFRNVFINEVIKLWRRTTVKVMLIVALIIAAITPLADMDIYDRYSFEYDDIFYDWMLSEYSSVRETRDRALELGVESGEWRMKLVAQIVSNAEYIENCENHPESLSKEEISSVEEARKANELYWKLIEENDFSLYVGQMKTDCGYGIAAYREGAEAIKAFLEKDADKYTEKERELLLEISGSMRQIADLGEKTFDEAVAKGMRGSAADTRLIDSVAETLASVRGIDIEPKGDHDSSYAVYSYDFGYDGGYGYSGSYVYVYGEYLNDSAASVEKTLEKIAVAEYAAENGNTELTTARSLRYKMLSLVT